MLCPLPHYFRQPPDIFIDTLLIFSRFDAFSPTLNFRSFSPIFRYFRH